MILGTLILLKEMLCVLSQASGGHNCTVEKMQGYLQLKEKKNGSFALIIALASVSSAFVSLRNKVRLGWP